MDVNNMGMYFYEWHRAHIGSFVLSYEMLEWYKGKGGEVYDRVLKEL